MCGLIGYAGVGNYNVDKLKILYLYNEHRGTDSCGAYIKGKGIVKVDDKASKYFLPYLHIPESNIFLGHVRQGTVGSKVKENSHPFREDNLIQVHNGKIENYLTFTKEYELSQSIVDSHAMLKLFKYFQNKDEKDYLVKTLQEVEGPIAMFLYDVKKPNEFIFFRNAERPMFFGHVEEGNYYFSSVEDGLLAIGVNKDNIIDVQTNTFYILNVETNTFNTIPFNKIIKPKVYIPPVPTQSPNMVPYKNGSTILSQMRNIYNDALEYRMRGKTSEKPKETFDKIKTGTKVEVVTNEGESMNGVIVASQRPYNKVYMVKLENHKLDFFHESLVTEIVEDYDDRNVVLIPSRDEYYSFRLTNSKSDIRQLVGKVTYVASVTRTVILDVGSKEQGYKHVEIPYDQLTRKVTVADYRSYWDLKDVDNFNLENTAECNKCNDTGYIEGIECDVCTATHTFKANPPVFNDSPFIEDIPGDDEDLLNYEDYDNASDLYAALESCPSFYDTTKAAEAIAEEDYELSTKIAQSQKNIATLEQSMTDDTASNNVLKKSINRLKVVISEMKDRRGVLLTLLINIAREAEEVEN